MSGSMLALCGFGGMLVLIMLRMHVGLAMLVSGAIGYVSVMGFPALIGYMKTNTYHQFANYTLGVIPMFILMGAFAERSGLARDLFGAARALIGHFRGGLAMAVIGAATVFGAICGSSVAASATFARTALPELRRYEYEAGFATGTIAIAGVVSLLIPPSVILVIYAIATEQNIAKLFKAALVPGLLAVALYLVAIAVTVRLKPDWVPQLQRTQSVDVGPAVLRAWPAVLVILLVIGGIYGGVFTPTEAAAVGTIAMMLVGIFQRTLGGRDLIACLIMTAETTAMIFIILLGSEVFNAFLALTQLPTNAAEWVGTLGLPPLMVVAVLLLFYIILGAVMDELAMIILTLPVFFPIVQGLELGIPSDLVGLWFGILVLSVVGIGLTAPPMGLNVFVVSAIAKDVPIQKSYRGVMPFLVADIIKLLLVLFFPVLAIGLVR